MVLIITYGFISILKGSYLYFWVVINIYGYLLPVMGIYWYLWALFALVGTYCYLCVLIDSDWFLSIFIKTLTQHCNAVHLLVMLSEVNALAFPKETLWRVINREFCMWLAMGLAGWPLCWMEYLLIHYWTDFNETGAKR